MLPQLSQCCCGCSLQTGCILIGVYQVVRAVFELISELVLEFSGLAFTRGWGYIWDGFPFAETILGVIKITAALVLIFAAKKERPRLVFWVLIVDVALLIVEGALFPLTVAIYFMFAFPSEAVIVVLLALVNFALQLYFLWVVFSYYRIIEERAPKTTVSA